MALMQRCTVTGDEQPIAPVTSLCSVQSLVHGSRMLTCLQRMPCIAGSRASLPARGGGALVSACPPSALSSLSARRSSSGSTGMLPVDEGSDCESLDSPTGCHHPSGTASPAFPILPRNPAEFLRPLLKQSARTRSEPVVPEFAEGYVNLLRESTTSEQQVGACCAWHGTYAPVLACSHVTIPAAPHVQQQQQQQPDITPTGSNMYECPYCLPAVLLPPAEAVCARCCGCCQGVTLPE